MAKKPSNHPGARLVRALKANNLEPPKTKKDGSPLVAWKEEVALRLAKKEARMAENGGVDPLAPNRLCKAHTTGVHGPKRPCGKAAVNGLEVCWTHGGSTKAAKESARRRLVEELDPTIARLVQIRDQDEHMPSALGASVQILNRVMGKPDSVDKDKGAGKPIIKIGIAIAGIPKAQITAAALIEDGNTIEGETVDEE